MTTMDKIREAVDRLDSDPDTPEFQDMVRQLAESHHLGLRAYEQWLTKNAKDAEWLVDDACQHISPGDDQLPSICIAAYPILVETDRRGTSILVMLFPQGIEAPMAEYIYDTGTDILTRLRDTEGRLKTAFPETAESEKDWEKRANAMHANQKPLTPPAEK